MPPSEIAGNMEIVKIPMEIHGSDLSYGSVMNQFFDFGRIRAPSVIKANDEVLFRATFGVKNCLTFVLIGGQWFFSKHIASVIQSFDYKFMVIGVHCGHDYEIWILFLQHGLDIQISGTIYAHILFGISVSAGIVVRQAHKLQNIRILIYQTFPPTTGPANSGSHQYSFKFSPSQPNILPGYCDHGTGCQHGHCPQEISSFHT